MRNIIYVLLVCVLLTAVIQTNDKIGFGSYDLYDEGGYLKGNSANLIDNGEMISKFDGNLIFTKNLLSGIGENGRGINVDITYNGSVSHTMNAVLGNESNKGSNTISMNLPEWIMNVNGVPVQVFNFVSNEFRTLKGRINSDNYTNDSGQIYPCTGDWDNDEGYEYICSQIEGKEYAEKDLPIFVDGFHKVNTGLYFTDDNSTYTASEPKIYGEFKINVLNSDGTTSSFIAKNHNHIDLFAQNEVLMIPVNKSSKDMAVLKGITKTFYVYKSDGTVIKYSLIRMFANISNYQNLFRLQADYIKDRDGRLIKFAYEDSRIKQIYYFNSFGTRICYDFQWNLNQYFPSLTILQKDFDGTTDLKKIQIVLNADLFNNQKIGAVESIIYLNPNKEIEKRTDFVYGNSTGEIPELTYDTICIENNNNDLDKYSSYAYIKVKNPRISKIIYNAQAPDKSEDCMQGISEFEYYTPANIRYIYKSIKSRWADACAAYLSYSGTFNYQFDNTLEDIEYENKSKFHFFRDLLETGRDFISRNQIKSKTLKAASFDTPMHDIKKITYEFSADNLVLYDPSSSLPSVEHSEENRYMTKIILEDLELDKGEAGYAKLYKELYFREYPSNELKFDSDNFDYETVWQYRSERSGWDNKKYLTKIYSNFKDDTLFTETEYDLKTKDEYGFYIGTMRPLISKSYEKIGNTVKPAESTYYKYEVNPNNRRLLNKLTTVKVLEDVDEQSVHVLRKYKKFNNFLNFRYYKDLGSSTASVVHVPEILVRERSLSETYIKSSNPLDYFNFNNRIDWDILSDAEYSYYYSTEGDLREDYPNTNASSSYNGYVDVEDAGSVSSKYTLGKLKKKTARIDANEMQIQTRITYNTEGILPGSIASVKDAAGNITEFFYGEESSGNGLYNNFKTSWTKKVVHTTRPTDFECTQFGEPFETTNSYHQVRGDGLPFIEETNSGARVQYEYDPVGRITSLANLNNSNTDRNYYVKYNYNDEGHIVTQMVRRNGGLNSDDDSFTNKTYYFDSIGRLSRIEKLAQATSKADDDGSLKGPFLGFFYYNNLFNKVNLAEDFFGRTTRMEYDNFGRISKTVSYEDTDKPAEEIKTYEYVTEIENYPSEFKDDLSYGRYFKLEEKTIKRSSDTEITVYTYTNNIGQILYEMTKGETESASVYYNYDRRGNLTDVIKPMGDREHYEFDWLGRTIEYTNANDRLLEKYVYNNLGQLIFKTTGNLERNSKIIRYELDGSGRIISEALLNGHIENGEVTTYLEGSLSYKFRYYYGDQVPNFGNIPQEISSFVTIGGGCNKLGLLNTEIGYTGNGAEYFKQYSYDEFGNPVNEYHYFSDLKNSDGSLESYEILYAYTNNQVLAGSTTPNGLNLNYETNKRGLTSKMMLMQSGPIVLKPMTYEFYYNRNDKLTELYYPNKTVGKYSYNMQSKLEEITTFYNFGADDERKLLQLNYNYDNIGNILSILKNGKSGSFYEYDFMNRLISEDNARGQNYQYNYDLNGNIISREYEDGTSDNYSYYAGSNKVLSALGNEYIYDENGNVTERDNPDTHVEEFRYDYRNLVTEYEKTPHTKDGGGAVKGKGIKAIGIPGVPSIPEDPDETSVRFYYYYNASGKRIKKSNLQTGETTYYIYRGNEPICEINNRGDIEQEFIFFLNQKILEVSYDISSASVRHLHTDHLGSLRMMTDNAGNSIWEADYYAFGRQYNVHTSGDLEQNYGFTGKEYDSESGLNYYGSRFYDPNLGRFLQVDVFNHQERYFNPYVYCADNPLTYVDPDGKWKEIKDKDGNVTGWEKDGNDDTVDGLMKLMGLDLESDYARQIAEQLVNKKSISLQDFEIALERVFADFVQDLKEKDKKLLSNGHLNNMWSAFVETITFNFEYGNAGCNDQAEETKTFVNLLFNTQKWDVYKFNIYRIYKILGVDFCFSYGIFKHNYVIAEGYENGIKIKLDSWDGKKGTVKVINKGSSEDNRYNLGVQNPIPAEYWLGDTTREFEN